MNDQTDSQLLGAYAENHSEAAFTELVRRHVDFVYSAARRMVVDPHLAEDVTQGVFVAFARNARQLTNRAVLSGWLHRTAQNLAAQTVHTIERRRAREQESVAMNELLAHESEAVWENIAPHLDAALGELSEPDRDALLLRYFERKSAREMAATLNVSEEAAQKRVTRAVERLREFFLKRKVTVGASGLVVLISANAVQAAPSGLALSISAAAALVGTAAHTSIALAATKTIAMTTLQKTLIAATITASVGLGIFEARRASNLQKEIQTLREGQSPLTEQIQRLQSEREDAAKQLAGLREENERMSRNTSEILKLRAEVTNLRHQSQQASQTKAVNTNDPTTIVAQAWLDRVKYLKQRFEQWPGRKTPEIQLLTDEDWLKEAPNARLETEQECLQTMANVRAVAKRKLNDMVQPALLKYVKSNNQYPITPSDLAPFFDASVDAKAILEGYKNAEPGAVHPPASMRADRWAMVQAGESNPLDYEFIFCEGGYFQTR